MLIIGSFKTLKFLTTKCVLILKTVKNKKTHRIKTNLLKKTAEKQSVGYLQIQRHLINLTVEIL